MPLLCCGVSVMTWSASACSRCTVLVARPSVIDFWDRFDMGVGRRCCLILSKFWKDSGRTTRLRSLRVFNSRVRFGGLVLIRSLRQFGREERKCIQ